MKIALKLAALAMAAMMGNSLEAQTVAPVPPTPAPRGAGGGFGGGMIGSGGGAYAPAKPARVALERGTYLGLLTSPVSAALREQLRLAKGTGLIVDHVEEQSPAAQAGLKQYDILQKLDDQVLINNQQLMVLVRMYKPQAQIRFQVIRQGQPMTLTARLVEGDVPPIDENNPWGLNPGNLNGDVFHAPAAYAPTAVHALATTVNGRGGVQTKLDDGNYELVITDAGGGRSLRALNVRTGNTIYSGPIDTPEQQKALPAEIEQRVRTLEENARLDKLELGAAIRKTRTTDEHMTISYTDDDVDLRITRDNGRTRLKASGKFNFDGPIDTAQERDNLPDGLKAKLKQAMAQQKKAGGPVIEF